VDWIGLKTDMGWKRRFAGWETREIRLKTNHRVSLFYEIFFKNIYHSNSNGKRMICSYLQLQDNNGQFPTFGKQKIPA